MCPAPSCGEQCSPKDVSRGPRVRGALVLGNAWDRNCGMAVSVIRSNRLAFQHGALGTPSVPSIGDYGLGRGRGSASIVLIDGHRAGSRCRGLWHRGRPVEGCDCTARREARCCLSRLSRGIKERVQVVVIGLFEDEDLFAVIRTASRYLGAADRWTGRTIGGTRSLRGAHRG